MQVERVRGPWLLALCPLSALASNPEVTRLSASFMFSFLKARPRRPRAHRDSVVLALSADSKTCLRGCVGGSHSF